MDPHALTREHHVKNDSKIVMLVADGLGGLPMSPGGKTELESAKKPNLDALAKVGVQGGSIPVIPGIAPGSGPGHLGLFGYDPVKYLIGRGALEATGIGFAMQPGDVAARGNFCTLDGAGTISDRRAGRIASEESAPQAVGVPPLAAEAHDEASKKTAEVANKWIAEATKLLAGEKKANGLTLRGFAARPALPSYEQVYGLKAAAIAVYPMYKGLAQLVGMDIVGKVQTLSEQIDVL